MTDTVTIRALFGAIQSGLAFSVMFLALALHFDLFSIQSAFGIADEALGFQVAVLLMVGFVSLAGGLFLVYEWWKSR